MRLEIRDRPVPRTPFLVAGLVAMLVGGLLVLNGLMGVGAVPLLIGGLLVILGARPAIQETARILLEEQGVTDTSLKVGPIPWHEIRGAAVQQLGSSFTLVTLDVVDPARWERQTSEQLGRLRELSARLDFQLPAVFLAASRLDHTAEEIAREINARATGR